jgi:hypothetical protein
VYIDGIHIQIDRLRLYQPDRLSSFFVSRVRVGVALRAICPSYIVTGKQYKAC